MVLRTPDGERTDAAGDVACFPPGPAGAHAVRNDGEATARFAMPSSRERFGGGAIYPDSGKFSIARSRFSPPRPARRRGAVLGGRGVNVFDVELSWDEDDPKGYHVGYKRLGPDLGAEQLGMSVYELPPGQERLPVPLRDRRSRSGCSCCVGRPTLRTPEGEHELREWDCAFFPDGEAGAHKVTNRTDETVRIAIWSNKGDPGAAVYPDSNKVGVWPPGKLFRLGDDVSYWEGETPDGLPDTRKA